MQILNRAFILFFYLIHCAKSFFSNLHQKMTRIRFTRSQMAPIPSEEMSTQSEEIELEAENSFQTTEHLKQMSIAIRQKRSQDRVNTTETGPQYKRHYEKYEEFCGTQSPPIMAIPITAHKVTIFIDAEMKRTHVRESKHHMQYARLFISNRQ